MGLRTASVRRPHVEVMAPALTETSQQGQKFELPPKGKLEPASFGIIDCENKNNNNHHRRYRNNQHLLLNGDVACGGGSTEEQEHFNLNKCSTASDNNVVMNVSPASSMADDQMGIEKTAGALEAINKDNNKIIANDVDQLLNTLTGTEMPEPEGEEEHDGNLRSVEDIMQVIKSMEGGVVAGVVDKVNSAANDLSNENEDIFPNLTNNLSSFEKELLENVDDVMNMSIEDQHDDVDKQKESQANNMLKELHQQHAKIKRRLEFLRRRAYKLQARAMGQHASGEIAGVFENIHRVLKKEGGGTSSGMFKHDAFRSLSSTSSMADLGSELLKPMSLASAKSLLKKLDITTNVQSNAVERHQRPIGKYFGAGSLDGPIRQNVSNNAVAVVPWSAESKLELQKVTNQLTTQLSIVQQEVDSEATESSSGGESCDETSTYNNPHQQYLPIHKRALWKYSNERASIAARWTWLQSQVSDLEYRIKQHSDLHKQIRLTKGPVKLGGASPPHPSSSSSVPPSPGAPVNGYRGQLPGSSPLMTKSSSSCEDVASLDNYQCARTRPLIGFKKRKLLQISGLHVVSKKAARPSTIKCGCLCDPCVLCTGRSDPTSPRDPPHTMNKLERASLLDPSFHPVFSLPEDIPQNIHLEALMKVPEWQQRCTMKGVGKVRLDRKSNKMEHRKKYERLLKPSTMSALSAKIKNKMRGRKPGRRPHSLTRFHHKKRHADKDADYSGSGGAAAPSDVGDEEVESIGNNSSSLGGLRSYDSPNSSPLLQMQSIAGYRRNRIHSYDIDNIVIPYSVAASTRVEKLQYKEILTPKWRIADPDYDSMFTNKNEALNDFSEDCDIEDPSEEAVIARHERCEIEEKRRFLSYLKVPGSSSRARAHKRTDSRAESSGANTPDPMSPHNAADQQDANSPMTSPPATPLSVVQPDDSNSAIIGPPSVSLPSITALRRRTISQSRFARRDDEVTVGVAAAVDEIEVTPYEKRSFPIDDETFQKMLQSMPENHQQVHMNTRAQDSGNNVDGFRGYVDNRRGESPDSESTESAVGDGEEDPNDPEWIDMERANRERYRR